MRESNRMLPSREGNQSSPQRHKYSEMVGTHHLVGARDIVAGRFWAGRGGETTSRHGCEHATAYGRMAPLSFSSSKLVLAFRPVCELAIGKSTPGLNDRRGPRTTAPDGTTLSEGSHGYGCRIWWHRHHLLCVPYIQNCPQNAAHDIELDWPRECLFRFMPLTLLFIAILVLDLVLSTAV